MAHPYQHIIEEIRKGSFCVIEPFRSQKTTHGIALSSDRNYWYIPKKEWWEEFIVDLFSGSITFVCFDMRRLLDLPIAEIGIIDVCTIMDGDATLVKTAREKLSGRSVTVRLVELENMAAANMRALKAAHVDVGSNFDKTMTPEFFAAYLKARVNVIHDLYMSVERSQAVDDWWRRLDFIKAIHEIELNGIRIDKDFVDAQLLKNQDPSTAKTLRSMQGLYRSGFVTALFNVAGTKTGRLRPEGGFNAMGVPHGPARNAIISRFKDGKIYSFDYNAIDYRSIVSSIGGSFADLYRDSRDFHTRTAQFIFRDVDEVRREALKAISYTSIYGGSESTLAQRTGLSPEMIRKVLQLLEEPLRPIAEFRENLWGKFQIDGFIEIPGVGRYERREDETMHPGKLLALFAQGYSAYIFERSLTNVHSFVKEHGRGSCIIFPVHDELVLDVHPVDEEAGLPTSVVVEMETGVADGFVVNYKCARSYGEID